MQGIWSHSVRLAFQQAVSPSFDITVNDKPGFISPEAVKAASDAAESCFEIYVKGQGDIKSKDVFES